MVVLFFFLLFASICILFCCEDSMSSRLGVGLFVGFCIVMALLPLLPEEWVEAIPTHWKYGFSHRRAMNPRTLLGTAIALGIGYPLAACALYPLRDRLMAAFDRRFGGKER